MIVAENSKSVTLVVRDCSEVLQMYIQPTCVHRHVNTAVTAVYVLTLGTSSHSDTIVVFSRQAPRASVVAGFEQRKQ
jgi:hypothetical protein